MGSSSRVPLHTVVQKSQACALRSQGQQRLTSVTENGAEVLQRAAQAGTGTAPSVLSLGPTADKTPWVKEC